MRGTNSSLLRLTLVFGFTQYSFGQSKMLTTETKLLESSYCLDPNNSIDLRQRIQFEFHNVGGQPILLPWVGQVAQFKLFPNEAALAANRLEGQEVYVLHHPIEMSELDPAKPTRLLFDTIEPGGIRVRNYDIFIHLKPSRRPALSLLGRDHLLQVELNFWSQDRRTGETKRRMFQQVGLLWIDNIVSPPLKLHVEKDPLPKHCLDRID